MTDYTTPPPPPPAGGPGYGAPGVPAGKDNSQLIGIIGTITGLLCCFLLGVGLGIWSLNTAKKFGSSPLWGYLAIGAGVLNLIGGIIYQVALAGN